MPEQPRKPDEVDAQTGRPDQPTRPGGDVPDEEREQFRQPDFWYNEINRETSFKIEDERWRTSEQIRDWFKLLLMVVATIVWGLIIYFLEPGLR